MSLSYAECQELIKRGRNGRKKLKNNVYLHFNDRDHSFAVRMYQTDIVTIYQDGTYKLDTGGWQTMTTKQNINTFTPVYIWQRKGEWFLNVVGTNTCNIEFKNGMIINPSLLHALVA